MAPTKPQTTDGVVDHSAEAANTSPLTDKLPPEIRIRIYENVLRADHPLLPLHENYPARLHLSQIQCSPPCGVQVHYADAFDVFFERNTIRFNDFYKLDQFMRERAECKSLIRHLEIVSPAEFEWRISTIRRYIMQDCLRLPRFKSLTIASEVPGPTMLRYLNHHDYDLVLDCVDIGLFKLDKSVYVKHGSPYKAWAEVKARGPVEIAHYVSSYAEDWEDALYEVDLPAWCACYDSWRILKHEGWVLTGLKAKETELMLTFDEVAPFRDRQRLFRYSPKPTIRSAFAGRGPGEARSGGVSMADPIPGA